MMTRHCVVVVQPTELQQVNFTAALLAEAFGGRPADEQPEHGEPGEPDEHDGHEGAGDGCATCGGPLERGAATALFPAGRDGGLAVTNVPSNICVTCGRSHFSPATTLQLEEIEADAPAGSQVDFGAWIPRLPFELGRTA